MVMSRFSAVAAPTYMDVLGRLATCAVVFAVGCGGSSAVLQSNDGGSEGAVDAADAPDATDAAQAPPNVGDIVLWSINATTAAPPTESSMVNAGFTLAAPSMCGPETVVDGCTISDCKVPPTMLPKPVSAGAILVNGGKQPLTLTTKQPDYYSVQNPFRLWDGGEELHVVVAGDVAPAFSLSVIAPAYLLVDAPVWPASGTALTVPRATDLKFHWTGGGAGTIQVNMRFAAGTAWTDAICVYPAQSAFAKVSAKVLGMLPASTTTTNTIDVISLTHATTSVSGWTMNFSAVASANTPTGLASASLVLQ